MHLPTLPHPRRAHGPDAPSLYALLEDAHRALDEHLAEVVDAVDAGLERAALVEVWRAFDHALRAHLDLEETWLLPGLQAAHPEAVQALREEHDALRAWLEELDLAVELHHVRAEPLLAFLEALRAHARTEDRGIYRWADQELEPRAQVGLRRALSPA